MKILVDADACPVKDIIISCAKKYGIPVLMVTDVTHILTYDEDFVSVQTVDKGADSADLVIANHATPADISITADYGLAALLLAKRSVVIHPNGFFYSAETIDRMLFERHVSREMRKQRKFRGGKIKKRTTADDAQFLKTLEYALS